MSEKSPKKEELAPNPLRRTLSSVENDLGLCAETTRDQLEGLVHAEERMPSLSTELGIEEELQDAFEASAQDSLEVANAKEAFQREALEATQLEVAELEEKIRDAIEEFKGLASTIEEVRGKLKESKKISRRAKVDLKDHLEVFNHVKTAKSAVNRLGQLKLEFDMWTKRLKTINKRSKVLKDPEVVKLAVLFQKMDNTAKR
ncbi:hypothetical protein HZA44_00085 [Candidatus Peregrinibacteria bacterium]|nr:hypothetical protein [Candidatus Peregrinibacteria bacterium]